MAGAVVYEGDLQRTQPTAESLFAGQKLWFAQRVPQRQWLIQNAELNGAQIVQLDHQADVVLVDHARKNQPPGSYSYRYVEQSIRNGKLEDLSAHRVGATSRADRPVGSVVTASKGGRNKFTPAEDQLLWNWVKPYQDAGGAWKGNDIYKQLERVNPNHTFQSWRDRWIKFVQFETRQITEHTGSGNLQTLNQTADGQPSPKRRKLNQQSAEADTPQAITTVAQSSHVHKLPLQSTGQAQHKTQDEVEHQNVEAPKTEPTEQQISGDATTTKTQPTPLQTTNATAEDQDRGNPTGKKPKTGRDGDKEETTVSADHSRLPLAFNFTQQEARMLYKATCHILRAREEKLDESWASVAREYEKHTKEIWMKFFYNFIVPEYKRRHKIESDEQLEEHVRMRAKKRKKAKQNSISSEDEERSSSSESEAELDADECVVCKNTEQMHRLRGQQEGRRVCVDCLRTLISSDETLQPITLDVPPTNETLNHALNSGSLQIASRSPRSSGLPAADPQPEVSVWFRPPKPNESRKLSQGRGSQSTQTQSQSRSNSNSQPSQRAQPLRTLREEPAPPSPAHHSREHVTIDEENHAQNALPNLAPRLNHSQEHHENTDQFVTQASEHEREHRVIPKISQAEPIEQNKEGIQVEEETDSESLLFVPEENTEQSSSSPRDDFTEEDISEQLSSQPVVQLVDEDEMINEADKSTGYSPSEATSEAVQFDSEAQLSHAWETAPEQIAAGSGAESEADDDDENIEIALPKLDGQALESQQTATQPSVSQNAIEISSDDVDDQTLSPDTLSHSPSKKDDFETAPTHANTEAGSPAPGSRLDTQALFNQPTQANFTQLVAIPEPPGGWDDDGEDENDDHEQQPYAAVHTQKDRPTSSHSNSTVRNPDWTLPLPDLESASIPDSDPNNAAPQASDDTSDNEVGTWLEVQATSKPHVPKYLLKPLSHRALESSSMDLVLASRVLDLMLRALDLDDAKGKRATSAMYLAVQELRSLPRRDRPRAVSQLIDRVVPQDVSGCWTKDDDAALLGVNGREVKRVEDKHGEDGVRRRFEFLELWHG